MRGGYNSRRKCILAVVSTSPDLAALLLQGTGRLSVQCWLAPEGMSSWDCRSIAMFAESEGGVGIALRYGVFLVSNSTASA